ncbi:MAG: DUF6622 family protein [Cypionkella sp.]
MTAIVPTVVEIVTHTPVWVWFVLLALIWRGLASVQSTEVGLPRLVLLPLVLIALSAYTVLAGGISSTVLSGLAVGALGGAAAGLTLERRNPATAIGNGRLLLAGEWTPLVVILAIFLSRYVRTVTGIMAPALAASAPFFIVMSAISAFFSLMLLTRTTLRLRVLLAADADVSQQHRQA